MTDVEGNPRDRKRLGVEGRPNPQGSRRLVGITGGGINVAPTLDEPLAQTFARQNVCSSPPDSNSLIGRRQWLVDEGWGGRSQWEI